LSKADIRVSQFRWQIVPDSRSATEKSLSPKLFCVRGTTHVLYPPWPQWSDAAVHKGFAMMMMMVCDTEWWFHVRGRRFLFQFSTIKTKLCMTDKH